MRVSRHKAQENRDAVLDAAARLFRDRGLDGVGVAEITRAAGLTHGGFYGQFPGGKDELAAEAVGHAFARTRAMWNELAAGKPPVDAVAAIAGTYLSPGHLAHPGAGCPVPLLAADAARQGGPVRAAFTEGVRDLIEAFAAHMAGDTAVARQAGAIRLLAAMAGAVLLARAVDDACLAEAVLDAVGQDDQRIKV